MKNVIKHLGGIVFVAVMGVVLAGCASMTLISVDMVEGPSRVRQGDDITPSQITVWGIYKDDSRKIVNINASNIMFNKNATGPQTVRVRVRNQEGSFQTEVMALLSVTISSPPSALIYKQGQGVTSWPGLAVQGEWDQMGSQNIPLSSVQVTGYNSAQVGTQSITVSYMGKTASFNVTVRAMSAIRITQNPAKVDYAQDEALSLTGLQVVGVWEGLPEEQLSIEVGDVTGYNANTTGIQRLTVTKNGRSATFNVEVLGLTSIVIDEPPNKTDYAVGEQLDLAGIVVNGNYTGTTAGKRMTQAIPVAQLTASGFNSTAVVRNQRVSVTVRGQTANFFVNITTAVPSTSPSGIEMVRIQGGTFQMGSPGSDVYESPQHSVTLTGFYMGRYEVTQEQYEAVMGYNPSAFDGTDRYNYKITDGEIQRKRPVERVSWFDAIEFCNRLSEREGLTPTYTIRGRTPATGYPITEATVTPNWSANGYRLPTEAQWEYACRAGTTTVLNDGTTQGITNSTTGDQLGWFNMNSNTRTHEVGKKAPNAWGLYDMPGNVREWCWDWFFLGYYSWSPAQDPKGPDEGSSKIARGGSWDASNTYMRSASRGGDTMAPRAADYRIGFRIVRP